MRGLSDTQSDGCCPPSDPCGETVESGNCMLCDCDGWGEEDPFSFSSLRSGFNVEENNASNTGIGGLERESGKDFQETDTREQTIPGIELFGSFEETTSNHTQGLGLRSGLANNDFAFDLPHEKEEEEEDELSYLVGQDGVKSFLVIKYT